MAEHTIAKVFAETKHAGNAQADILFEFRGEVSIDSIKNVNDEILTFKVKLEGRSMENKDRLGQFLTKLEDRGMILHYQVTMW